ncbi:MAG: glycosyltransferase family 4 protein [Chloroflexi bacterium]|nr:glycosyltransferase family 4 protein [Chloroflexota bacterium]
MRIVLDITPLDTGHRTRGVGTYMRGLLQGLQALNPPHEWILIAHTPSVQIARPMGARIIPLPRPRLGRLTALVTHQILMPIVLSRLDADLVHFPGISAHLSVTGVPWRVPLPFVVTVHDFTPLHMPELLHGRRVNHWWYARQRRWARRAERLICVSRATRDDAVRFLDVPATRCTVIYEGVDTRRFHPADAPRPDPPFILFVGGDFPNKNRDAALQAFARLTRETDLPHRLVLVGPNRRDDAELAARYPGLDLARVTRVPHLAPQELAARYRQADLFLFPSRHEGFGLPVLEAMASGTPVITSTAASLPEIAGDAAILVEPDDVEGLYEAMRRVLTDPELKRRLREAGLERAKRFTWTEAARQTVQVYEAIGRDAR